MDMLRKVLARFIVARLISDGTVIMYLGRVVGPGDKRSSWGTRYTYTPGHCSQLYHLFVAGGSSS